MSKTKIDAIQWTGVNFDKIVNFIEYCCTRVDINSNGLLSLLTLNGVYEANEGDYIVKTGKHSVIVFEKSMFESAYVIKGE